MASQEIKNSFTEEQISGPKGPSGYPESNWHPVFNAANAATGTDVLGHNTESIPHKPKTRNPKRR